MSPQIPKELDARESILFLGSGFSQAAENLLGQNLPTSQGLRREFAKLLEIDSAQYDIKTLADEVASRPDLDLYQTLYSLFTVQELQEDQYEILRLPWNRIYTTNYDDSIEFANLKLGNKAPSYDYNDEKPRKLPAGSVIHLHGAIRSTTDENVLQQLVLNENSYIRQHFERSSWYDDFIRDLRFCSACYFVGYSLADYHVSALLVQDPQIPKKTYFITRENPDQIFSNRLAPYGTILPIEVEGFAELCQSLPVPTSTNSPHAVRAFRYLDPRKDRETLSPPTAIEVLNLVTYGTFNYQRCLTTLPGGEYVVPRQELAAEATAKLRDARCLLVHSRIGNGKSIFLHIFAHMLSQQGYRCFLAIDDPPLIQRDVEILKTIGKAAIFFDSYNTAIVFIEQFSEFSPEIKFVVTVRTSVQEVRLHEIQSRLPTPLDRMDLNGISAQDSKDFRRLLGNSGLGARDVKRIIDRSKDFRDVVLALYNNEHIRQKIRNEFSPLLEDGAFRRVFIASLLLKWIGQDVDAAFLRSVTRSDGYAAIVRFRETAGDIFRLDDEFIFVRSAIFSEYLIRNFFEVSDIIECAYWIIVEAVKRKERGRYQATLSSLMKVSFLRETLKQQPGHLDALRGLFERLRRDVDVNKEPLFWLQYSILMTVDENLVAAENFIRTAYLRAESSPGFHTFQIDTFALGLFLRIEQEDTHAASVHRFDEIVEKLERVRSMLGEESRRFHAIQVLQGIEPFVGARISALSNGEKTSLVYHLNLLMQRLDDIQPEDRARARSETVRSSVSRAVGRILRVDPVRTE